jgi:hypothetical protein
MLKAGTKRVNAGHGQNVDGDWMGVLRDGSEIVWECGHRHGNRDHYSRMHGPAARTCAVDELKRRNTSN